MSKWPELARFCERYASLIRRGKHDVYMYEGRMIRVSHGSGEIPHDVWKDILKKELRMTQAEFNAAI